MAADQTAGLNPPLDPPRQNVTATVLDPNDPLVGQSTGSISQKSPIQPGQFVVAEGGSQAPPANEIPQTLSPPIKQEESPPPASFNFATSTQEPAPQSETSQAPLPPTGTPAQQQPDPTPYAPPPPTPGSQPQATQGSSMIKKLRIAAITVGALVLIGSIAAFSWFFFLGKSNQEPIKSQTQQETSTVEEPPPPPKRTEGGFGTLPALPQSTTSAQQSTPSAQ